MKKSDWPIIVSRFHLGKRLKLAEIKKYLAKKGQYDDCLDIGTGTGALALEYRQFGIHWTYVDNDKMVAEQASHLLGAKVLTDLSLIKDKKFDLITIVDTFYYFDDPDKMIRDLKSRLKADGEILVTLTDGSPNRLINKMRNKTGLGIEARKFVFEESPENFIKRLKTSGLEIIYYRIFSFFVTEFLLFLMDLSQKLTFRSSNDSDNLTSREKVSAVKLIFLVLTFPFIYIISLLDFPVRRFLRGYKFIVVAK